MIKQQLGSLVFVKNICEARGERIKEGLDENDAAVSVYLGPSQRGLFLLVRSHVLVLSVPEKSELAEIRLQLSGHWSLRGAVDFCMQKFLSIGRIGIF